MKKSSMGWMGALAVGLMLGALGIPDSSGQATDNGQGEPSRARVEIGTGLLTIDESMFEVSAATGGNFYFWSPDEFASSGLRIAVPGEAMLLSYGELDVEARGFTVPVDGLTGRLDIFLGVQRMQQVRILEPGGRAIRATDPGIDMQVFDRMCIASIARPIPGEWHIELEGRGKFCLTVHSSDGLGQLLVDHALESIELLEFRFVELAGRPGHRGYFAVKEPVAPGERHRLEVQLQGSLTTVELALVDLDGEFRGEVSVAALDRSADGLRSSVLAQCVVPSVPFRLLVRGYDATGARYQRMHASSVHPAARR